MGEGVGTDWSGSGRGGLGWGRWGWGRSDQGGLGCGRSQIRSPTLERERNRDLHETIKSNEKNENADSKAPRELPKALAL